MGRLLLLELNSSTLFSGLLLDQSLEWAYVWGPLFCSPCSLIPVAGPVPGVGVRLGAFHLFHLISRYLLLDQSLAWAYVWGYLNS